MKVISLWNPWAWLWVNAKKRIETRAWEAPAELQALADGWMRDEP